MILTRFALNLIKLYIKISLDFPVRLCPSWLCGCEASSIVCRRRFWPGVKEDPLRRESQRRKAGAAADQFEQGQKWRMTQPGSLAPGGLRLFTTLLRALPHSYT